MRIEMTDFNPQAFWKDPDKSKMPAKIKRICRPTFYLDQHELTELVCSTLMKYIRPHESIVELGSGTGRNLAGLKAVGYDHIAGIEISKQAIDEGRRRWRILNGVQMQNAAIEDILDFIPSVDCIFTLGTLMHIPTKNDWVFKTMTKKARHIIMTIELENGHRATPIAAGGNVYAWARNYGDIFTGFGWKELETRTCEAIMPLLGKDNILRVFEHG